MFLRGSNFPINGMGKTNLQFAFPLIAAISKLKSI